ncbi:MAG: hypothetical protein WDA42_06325, partial [Candidatus Bathyarchaeia archaeon]
MVAMTKVNFNTLSYDEGLALVKEAKEAALIKQADTGFADKGKELWATISQFLEDNPGLLRNLGIGAGVGGGLGIASGLMGDKKSRRPIRRGIIGALLGALGGGAVHGGLNLYDIYKKNQSVEGLKSIAATAMAQGMSREDAITAITAQANNLGLMTANGGKPPRLTSEDISKMVPNAPASNGVVSTLLDTAPDPNSKIPDWDDIPGRGKLSIIGAGVGGMLGNPLTRNSTIMRAARGEQYADMPQFATRLGTVSQVTGPQGQTQNVPRDPALRRAVDLLQSPRLRSWH